MKSQAPPRIAATALSTSPKRRHQQDRQPGVPARDLAEQRQAVHRVHAQIGNHHAEGLARIGQHLQRGRSAIDRGDAVAGGFEGDLQGVAQGVVVFDDEKVQGFVGHGSVSMNSAPAPGLEMTSMPPPWARATPRAMERPRPVPSARVVKKGSNSRAAVSAFMPRHCRVPNQQQQFAVAPMRRGRCAQLSLHRLQGVFQQVGQGPGQRLAMSRQQHRRHCRRSHERRCRDSGQGLEGLTPVPPGVRPPRNSRARGLRRGRTSACPGSGAPGA
jgi:hypothetical protein